VDAFKFSVTTTGAAPILQPGRYVYYRKATAGQDYPEIQVKTNTGDMVKLKPGEGFTFSRQYESLIITNADAQVTITGELVAGDGSFQANRIQGEVSVIDGGRTRTLNGKAFIVYGSNAGGVGKYGYIQLKNPSGSGLNCFVQNVGMASADQAGGLLRLSAYDTSLTPFGSSPRSKNIGGTDSTMELNYGEDASGFGTTILYMPFERIYEYKLQDFREPLMLAPGKGMLAGVLATGKQTMVQFQFFTEPSA
jgi:hypothetical protein